MAHHFVIFVVLWSLTVWVNGFPTSKNKLQFDSKSSEPHFAPSAWFEKQDSRTSGSFKSIGKSIECWACAGALDIALWKFKKPDGSYPGLLDFVTKMCEELKIESSAVCKGMVIAMGNETLYLLKRLNLTGSEVCGLIFPHACPAADLSWNRKHWTIPLPPKNNVKIVHKKRKESVIKVLQLSDIHVDMQYKPGSVVDCSDPLCCRSDEQTSGQNSHAGYWGSAGSCDTPYWTLENLLSHAASVQKYDYIIWTGDLPAHNDWNQSRSGQTFLLTNLTSLLLKYFPNTPVYPALGNHESDPVNSFPPNYISGYNNISWLYDALARAWSPWLPLDSIETVKQSGYYTVLIKPNFRLVSLNMNYCNNENFWMLVDPVDPNGELKWLVDTLSHAEVQGEAVHIIGHIPPAVGEDCLKVWRSNYYAIINRFRDTVVAQFFGHTHTDEIELMYSDESLLHPVAIAYICPSVTTYPNLYPGYRIYDVRPGSWSIENHYTYILNLTEANSRTSPPKWTLEYDAKSAYNITDLSVYSWHRLFWQWLGTDSSDSRFANYYNYFYKSRPPRAVCDVQCKKHLLSRITAANFTQFSYSL